MGSARWRPTTRCSASSTWSASRPRRAACHRSRSPSTSTPTASSTCRPRTRPRTSSRTSASRARAVEARNEADTTIYNTEKTLMEHKAKVPQEDQDTINADIAALKEALSDDSTESEKLKEAIEKLKQSQMKIGEAMYKNTDGGDGGDSSSSEEPEKKAEYTDEKDAKKDEKK